MWPGLFCNLVFPVHQRGEVPPGPSRIRSPTSLRRKVGMTAAAPSYPLCVSAARTCPANGRSHVIFTLISALRRAVHTAWCITTLESQLGSSRPHRHEQPSAQSYRRVFGRQLGPSMEPKYVVRMSVNPRLKAHVTLEQLCQRHLTPIGSLSPFTFPLLIVALLRDLLNITPHTSPYRDLIVYVLLRGLSDDNLQPLLAFYNAVLSGARVLALHHGDFALLPKKVTHGIVGNNRPLSNP